VVEHVEQLTNIGRQRVLYCPYMLTPGVYSPRYCLDSYTAGEPNTKDLMKSSKSYYVGNLNTLSKAANASDIAATAAPSRRPSVIARTARASKIVIDVDANGKPMKPTDFTVKRETVGLLLECLDELEIVWAENERWDIWPYDEGDGCSDDDDYEGAMKRQYKWRPQLYHTYPYLPNRKLVLSEPELIAVYINVPDHKNSLRIYQDGASPNDDHLIWGDVKVGVFFERTGELISDLPMASFWVNCNDPLHKIRLHELFQKDKSLSKEALKARPQGVYDNNGSLNLIIGFMNSVNAPSLHVPFVSLSLQENYDSEEEEDYDSGEEEELVEFQEENNVPEAHAQNERGSALTESDDAI
jgi:hypothetical protein